MLGENEKSIQTAIESVRSTTRTYPVLQHPAIYLSPSFSESLVSAICKDFSRRWVVSSVLWKTLVKHES